MNRPITFRALAHVGMLLLVVLFGTGSVVQRVAAAPEPDLTSRVQAAVVSYLGYQPTTDIIVTNLQQSMPWASGTVAIAAAPTEGSAPTAYLFLAQQLGAGVTHLLGQGGIWMAHHPGSQNDGTALPAPVAQINRCKGAIRPFVGTACDGSHLHRDRLLQTMTIDAPRIPGHVGKNQAFTLGSRHEAC